MCTLQKCYIYNMYIHPAWKIIQKLCFHKVLRVSLLLCYSLAFRSFREETRGSHTYIYNVFFFLFAFTYVLFHTHSAFILFLNRGLLFLVLHFFFFWKISSRTRYETFRSSVSLSKEFRSFCMKNQRNF